MSSSPPKEEFEVKPSETKSSQVVEDVPKFTPEEEADLRRESNTIKTEANTLFAEKDYQNAISRYTDALNVCPKYFHFERAVIQSNVAACYLKLEEWKDAIKAATSALDGLVEMEKEDQEEDEKGEVKGEDEKKSELKPETTNKVEEEEADEEIVSEGASKSAPAPHPTPSEEETTRQSRQSNIQRIRTKALLRRARARSQAGGWSNLSTAEEDYKTLASFPSGTLTPSDLQTVRQQLRTLPPRTKKAQEEEMAEMWGKMKNLGNKILNPFGLSTDNFQMTQDEKTGGYSMNFNQGGK